MSTRQKRNSRLSWFVVPVLSLALLSYFGYNAFQGRFGVHSARVLDQRNADLKLELAKLQAERMNLASRVALLRDGTMEQDMLDEKARFHLNMAKVDEIVIFRQAK